MNSLLAIYIIGVILAGIVVIEAFRSPGLDENGKPLGFKQPITGNDIPFLLLAPLLWPLWILFFLV